MSEEEVQEVQAPQLSLGDIEGCVKIIDIVTKRGAFEGSELADVGSVRNRLALFLQAQAKATADDENKQEEDGEVTDTETEVE